MFYLKCLAILGIAIMTAFCNNDTTTIETLETTTEGNVNLTTTSTVKAVEKTIPRNATSNMSAVIVKDLSNVKTTHFVLQGKRRAVVIINHQPTSALRNSVRGKKRGKKSRGSSSRKAKVESLLYEEYDADGTKLVEFMMYDLEQVSTFFATYLHTEICHVRCEPRPEDIAREEAKKANGTKT